MSPLLYEINTRCWLRELSEEAGAAINLANVPETEFAEWERLGFTHIWLMGVWTSGPRSRSAALSHPEQRRVYDQVLPGWADADIGASPYSISEYSVPSGLGGNHGLARFRERLKQRGLKLVLDFVPNHIGLDHRWLDSHPEYLVQSTHQSRDAFPWQTDRGIHWFAHGRDPNMPPWTDTIQVDYRVPVARAAMAMELECIADRCDGVRCDMAMLVLEDVFAKTWREFPVPEMKGPPEPAFSFNKCPVFSEGISAQQGHPVSVAEKATAARAQAENSINPAVDFWTSVIPRIKAKYPDFLFLAEVYWNLEARLQSLGFDYTYDKTLYDHLVIHDSVGIQKHLLGMGREIVSRCAHFLENHDELRIASLLRLAEQRAAAALILTLPGMRFLHQGQLEGATRRVPVQMLRRPREPLNAAVRAMYENLLALLPRTYVGRGQCELLVPQAAAPDNPTGQDFVLIQWASEGLAFDLVAINLANHRSQCFAPFKLPESSARNWKTESLLGNPSPAISDNNKHLGVYLDLPEYGIEVLRALRGV
jgi:hypothetical protein